MDELNNIPNSIYTNSKTDLIIVHLGTNDNAKERYDNSVSTIINLNQHISTQTSKYLAVYTGLSYDAPPKSLHTYSKRNVFQTSDIVFDQNNCTNCSNGSGWFFTYFGGWFWEVLLFVVITTPVLVAGIYAIDSIQSPDRFLKPKQK